VSLKKMFDWISAWSNEYFIVGLVLGLVVKKALEIVWDKLNKKP